MPLSATYALNSGTVLLKTDSVYLSEVSNLSLTQEMQPQLHAKYPGMDPTSPK